MRSGRWCLPRRLEMSLINVYRGSRGSNFTLMYFGPVRSLQVRFSVSEIPTERRAWSRLSFCYLAVGTSRSTSTFERIVRIASGNPNEINCTSMYGKSMHLTCSQLPGLFIYGSLCLIETRLMTTCTVLVDHYIVGNVDRRGLDYGYSSVNYTRWIVRFYWFNWAHRKLPY